MKRTLTTKEFIEKSKIIHGDMYDYSLVEYIHSQKKVKIICKKHGVFEQKGNNHMRGNTCPVCAEIKRKEKKTLTTEEFIKRAKKTHGDKYDYSYVIYENSNKNIRIKCNEHGIFEQAPSNHILGQGCPKCSYKQKAITYRKTTIEFIEEAKLIHDEKYDYSNVIYFDGKTKVIIICKKHGEFKQTPSMHLLGHGCSICRESRGEKEVRNILLKNNIDFISQKRFDNCRGKVHKLPFDFYLPNENILIEYDGIQHFKPIEVFGGEKGFNLLKETDQIKNEYCKKQNIKLIRIKYNNIKMVEKILKNENII